MSEPGDDRDGEADASIPPPSSWVPGQATPEPVDEWVVSSDETSATPPAGESADPAAPTPDEPIPPAGTVPPPASTPAEPGRWLAFDSPAPESTAPVTGSWNPAGTEFLSSAPATSESLPGAEPLPSEPGAVEPDRASAQDAAPSWSTAAESSPDPASERSLLDVPAPLTGAPRVPWDAPGAEPGVAPAADELSDASSFVQVPDEPLPAEPEPEPLAAEPVEAPPPGVNVGEPPESVAIDEPLPPVPAPEPEPTPFPDPVPVPEPTPTAFETVTDSTFTSEPEPAVDYATEQSTPDATAKVASLTAEHPEYLIAAALIGGFVLAKVVKKLAS